MNDESARLTIRSPWRNIAIFLGLYAIILALLIDIKPLWLDEVRQLSTTVGTNWHDLVQRVLDEAGQVPLGYFVQHGLISLAGYSVLIARLPSLLAGIGSLWIFLLLCRRLAIRASALAAWLWLLCPLTLRYSLEARPYMQAMFFANLAVLLQIELGKRSRAAWFVALAACLVAAVYSQPFAIFGPLGFAGWSTWQKRNTRYVALTFGAYALAGLSFLPWLLTTHARWAHDLARRDWRFEPNMSLLGVLFRECVGDGYFAAAPVLILAVYGAYKILRQPHCDARTPLIAGVISSVFCVFFADATFNYFFAIRQVMYMLPFLLILVAEGARILWQHHRVSALALLITFAGASITKDYSYLADDTENWERLSTVLMDSAGEGCILLPPGNTLVLYQFFRPEVQQRLCANDLAARVVTPVHHYTSQGTTRVRAELSAHGMTLESTESVGFANIEVYVRR